MTGSPSILLIEDSPEYAALLEAELLLAGFTVLVASTGAAGLRTNSEKKPSLILLDQGLPDASGVEICQQIRNGSTNADVPVLFLTGSGDRALLVRGLAAGADDYLEKPIDTIELIARIRAVLRRVWRTAPAGDKILVVGELTIDASRFEVCAKGTPVVLRPSEFHLLHALASADGRVCSREALLVHFTDTATSVIDRNVDVHIAALRKKLGIFGEYIQTVRGMGYKLSAVDTSVISGT